MPENHCACTCRDTHPNDPRSWCDGCHQDEANDREANMDRWRESEARRMEFESCAVAQQETDPCA